MPDLNGNEKHAALPRALPTTTIRPGTLRNGDLMLYGARTLVIFYKTFDSPYPYTRLGRVDDTAEGTSRPIGAGAEPAVRPRTEPGQGATKDTTFTGSSGATHL